MAHPSSTVAPACQNANRCSTATPAPPRRTPGRRPGRRGTGGAWRRSAAPGPAVLGCEPSRASRTASRLRATASRSSPSSHSATAPNARHATPGSWPNWNVRVAVAVGVVKAARRPPRGRERHAGSPAQSATTVAGLPRQKDQRRVARLLGQRQQLPGQKVRPAEVRADLVDEPQSPQDREQRADRGRPLPHLPGPRVRPFHVRGREPVGDLKLQCQSHQQAELAARVVRGVGQAAKQPQPAAGQRWPPPGGRTPARRSPPRRGTGRLPGRTPGRPRRAAPVRPRPVPAGRSGARAARRPGPADRGAPGRRKSGRQGVLVNRVDEPVPPRQCPVRELVLADEPDQSVNAFDLLKPLLDHGRLVARGAGHHRRVELPALCGSRGQQHPIGRLELVELPADQSPDRLRHLGRRLRDRPHQHPPVVPAGDDVAVAEEPDEFGDEERVTPGPGVERRPPGRVGTRAPGRPSPGTVSTSARSSSSRTSSRHTPRPWRSRWTGTKGWLASNSSSRR